MALDNHANVVNLSLGGETDSPFLRSLIEEASARGVLFFAAAGNTPVTTPLYPAADPGVVSVTAGDVEGGFAPYANRGAWVDVMAPGMNVVSYLDRSWYGAGTSFATSWVSGWAAGYMANSGRAATPVMQQTLERWAIPKGIARYPESPSPKVAWRQGPGTPASPRTKALTTAPWRAMNP